MNHAEAWRVIDDASIMLRKHPDVLEHQLIGSILTDMDNAKDVDFLVLMRPKGEDEEPLMVSERWAFGPEFELCVGEYDIEDDKWCAIRRGALNLIITRDPEWFEGAATANEVCVALDLKSKEDRVMVYRVVRDGYSASEAKARKDGSR